MFFRPFFIYPFLRYLNTWPDTDAAAELPTLSTFVGSWVWMVLVRNLVLEVSFYEFWHQLLFGSLASKSEFFYIYFFKKSHLPLPWACDAMFHLLARHSDRCHVWGYDAMPGITQYRYSEQSPYESKKEGGNPQMNVWRERFFSICGFCWSTAWECYIVHSWSTHKIPACSAASGVGAGDGGGGGSGLFGLGCQMSDLSLYVCYLVINSRG